MKKLLVFLVFLLPAGVFCPPAADAAEYATWGDIVTDMVKVLDQSYEAYRADDSELGKELVNKAYFEFYEKLGVERAVLSYVSGKRAAVVEYQFAAVKRLMSERAPNREVRAGLDELAKMLREDANQLDGKVETKWGVFVASLLILLREGFEAILVVAAIVAYLVRSGNRRMTRVVYGSGVGAILASALMALALQTLLNISGSREQEMLEGFTMLLAVAVLFFVSNWMVSKAESEAWRNYIEGKVVSAAATGSAFALGAAAFLAVFREGAETILFYQALLADTREHMDMLWYGFGVACVCLVAIFLVIRFGSLRLPLRPFFIGTSILMYIMAVSFAGGGVKELQEADLISVSPVSFIGTVDLLGIYPTVETLLPQLVMILLAVASFLHYTRKASASRKKAAA
jgi:high-affinity iron transporter